MNFILGVMLVIAGVWAIVSALDGGDIFSEMRKAVDGLLSKKAS